MGQFRSAYLYDVTASACLHKYTRLSDIGTSVSFHPLYPEVVFSFNDGKIRLFSARDNQTKPSNRKGGTKTSTVVGAPMQVRRQSTGGSGGGRNSVKAVQRQASADQRQYEQSYAEPEQSAARRSAVQELL